MVTSSWSLMFQTRSIIRSLDGPTPVYSGYNPFKGSSQWICPPTGKCDRKQLSQRWAWEQDVKVSYCLAQDTESHREVQFSVIIFVIVLACNVFKVVCMAILVDISSFKPLVMLGDAIASFLTQPDPYTVGKCLASKANFVPWRKITGGCTWALPYEPRRRRWFAAASPRRWFIIYAPSILLMLAAMMAMRFFRSTLGGGFGTLTPAGILENQSRDIGACSPTPRNSYSRSHTSPSIAYPQACS